MALARWLTRITPDSLLGFGKFSSYIYFLETKKNYQDKKNGFGPLET